MKYEYTYRDSAGALRTGQVEASGRTDAFAKVKGQGLNPVSMKVASRQGKDKNGIHSGKLLRNALLAALCVAAAAFCTWFFFAGNNGNPAPAAAPEKKKPAKKAVVPVVMPTAVPVAVSSNAPPVTAPKPAKKLTTEEKLAIIEKKILEKPMDFSTPTNNRAFRTGVEQSLAAIFATPLGAPPPPVPLRLTPVTYLRLQEILDAPNTVFDDDSDKVAEAKMAVAMAKKELKKYMAEGGDPEKFLEHYYSELKQASDEWKAAQMELVRTMKTDPGLAVTLEAELNEHFSKKGIRPVKMPAKLKERYGIE